jgi:RHS repeat-associated protein
LILNDGTSSYIYGPGGLPVEQVSSAGTTSFLHHDQQGSTRAISSTTGAVVGTTTYDGFGNKTGSTGTITTPLGYDAQYTDSDTGLIYLRARYYDQVTGQFLSVDPEVASTREPYGYTGQSPLDGSDPTGLLTEGLCGGLSAAVSGVGASGGVCAVKATEHGYPEQIGWTDTGGAGGALGAGASGSGYVQVSNARRVGGLAGPFHYATVSLELGGGATVTVFWSSNFAVYGIDVGLSDGLGAIASVRNPWGD